jgi:hypothetical protein
VGSRQVLGALAPLLLLLAGCGEQKAAKFAKSLVTNSANSAEVAREILRTVPPMGDSTVRRAVYFPDSSCPLGFEPNSINIKDFDHFVTGNNLPKDGQNSLTPGQRFACATEAAVLANPDPSKSFNAQYRQTGITEILKSPNPDVRSAGSTLQGTAVALDSSSGGGGASGGFMDVCKKNGQAFTRDPRILETACRGILDNDPKIIAKMDGYLSPFGITGQQLADHVRPKFLAVQGAGPNAVQALWNSAGTLADRNPDIGTKNLAAAVGGKLVRSGGNERIAITGPNTLPTFELDPKGTWKPGPRLNTQVLDQDALFTLDSALNPDN